MRRKRLRVMVGLLAILTGSCGKPESGLPPSVVVGTVLPLSGPDAETGRDVLLGLRLAAEREGSTITLLPVDGEGTSMASARKLRALARDPRVDVVIGGWLASTARTLAAVAGGVAVPFIALSPLAGASSEAVGNNLFLLHRIGALGQAAAVFAREDLGGEQAGIFLIPGSTASRTLGDAFDREFNAAGGQVAWTISPDEEGRVALPRGPEKKVDVIYVAGPSEWAERCLELGQKTASATILLADGWRLDAVDALVERGVPVYLAGFYCGTDATPAVQELLDACAQAELPASPAVALGWDSLRLVQEAAAAGGTSREAIRTALRMGEPLEGASGNVGHTRSAHSPETPALSMAARGGFVFVRRVEVVPPPPPGA